MKNFLFPIFILFTLCQCSDNDYVSVISFELEGKKYFFKAISDKEHENFDYFSVVGINKKRNNSIQIKFIPGKDNFHIQKDTLSVIILIDNIYYLAMNWPERIMYVDSATDFELEIKSMDENSIQGTFGGKIYKIDFSEQQAKQHLTEVKNGCFNFRFE